jgi:dCTP deaminase
VILTGPAIQAEVEAGRIQIDPFDPRCLNPNSYDFRLSDSLLVYANTVLDSARENPVTEIPIDTIGVVLDPSRVYLSSTVEVMGSDHYVPIIRGKSSTARLGLFINITADLIDIGSHNRWTLQLHCVQPVRIYPGMLIGQVTFWVPQGEIRLYDGKYQGSMTARPSESFRDFS